MNMDAFQCAHTNIDGLGYLRQSYKVFTRLGKSPEIPACYNDETPARSMFPANKSDQDSLYQVAVQVLNSARFERQNALHTLLESVTKALKTFRPRLGKQKKKLRLFVAQKAAILIDPQTARCPRARNAVHVTVYQVGCSGPSAPKDLSSKRNSRV
jgi:hypothetical protein